MVVLGRGSIRRAFALGLTTGAVYFVGTLYWLVQVMVVYGGLNTAVAVAVAALLVAYLALFPGIFAMIVRRLWMSFGPRALMAAPLVWVATELGRTHLFGGFPWVLLGYSQVTVLPVVQLASVFGVYGVSGLVAGVGSALATMAVTRRGSSRPRMGEPSGRPSWAYMWSLVVFLIVAGVASWGASRVARADLTREGEALKVGLVQGNVDQAQKWNEARATAIFAEYLRLTRLGMSQGADLMLWPESSTPFFFENDRVQADQVRALARQAKVPILFGSDQVERGTPDKYYNAAFLVRADGSTGGVYRKMHLVPFGEYVPLKTFFFFASRLVEAVSDFSPGESAVLLPVNGHAISTSICYEIVYPALVREFVRHGSALLTTITNDAWFGRTSAPYQHFAQASMRAIENGRYLVRSANTGISGIVDPYGHVLAQSGLFESTVVVGEARYLNTQTFYTQHGDVFAYACSLTSLILLLRAMLVRRTRSWPFAKTPVRSTHGNR